MIFICGWTIPYEIFGSSSYLFPLARSLSSSSQSFIFIVERFWRCRAELFFFFFLRWFTTSSEALQIPSRDVSCPAGQILVQSVIPYTCPVFVILFLSSTALGLEKSQPKKAKACAQNMSWMDGWLVRDSQTSPLTFWNLSHSLSYLF